MGEFVVGGQQVRITKEEVIKRLKGVEPGPIRAHAVKVQGRRYPVKEAFALTTGLDLLDFNTNQARSVFRRLGFELERIT